MSELSERAEALGIKVDGRWSDARLQEEIDKASTPKAKFPAGDTPIRLLYDTWFETDVRTVEGTVLSVDVETAKKLIATGKAERADPLPGEK